MNDPETVQFFQGGKQEVILLDVKPKLNKENEKRIRFDFALKLTAKALDKAPENIKEAFCTVAKDGLGLNPVGVTSEFEGANINFYATMDTKSPSLEVGNCTIRKLEVVRPQKHDLEDGDVRLKFHVNVPASMEVWKWSFHNYGAELAAEFQEMQPLLPHIKAADPDGANNGQGILEMEKSEASPTVVSEKPAGKPVNKKAKPAGNKKKKK